MPVGVLTKPRPTRGSPPQASLAAIVTPQPPCPPPHAQVSADLIGCAVKIGEVGDRADRECASCRTERSSLSVKPRLGCGKAELAEGRGYCGAPHRRFVHAVAGSPHLGYARVALDMAGRTRSCLVSW
jgi:hypothetical protein